MSNKKVFFGLLSILIALGILISLTVYTMIPHIEGAGLFFLGVICALVLTAAVICGIALYKIRSEKASGLPELKTVPVNRYHESVFSLRDELLFDRILIRVIKGTCDDSDTLAYEQLIRNLTSLDLNKSQFRLVIFMPDTQLNNTYALYRACSNYFTEAANGHLKLYFLEIDGFLVAICFPMEGDVFEEQSSWLEMTRYINYVRYKIDETYDITLHISAGGRHTTVNGLAKAYNEALIANKYQEIFEDDSSIVFYNNLEKDDTNNPATYDDIWYDTERKLIAAVVNTDFSEARREMENLCDQIEACSPDTFHLVKYRAFGVINSICIEISKNLVFQKELLNLRSLYSISASGNISELIRSFRQSYTMIENILIAGNESSDLNVSKRIKDIQQFIRDHYSDTDLSVVYIADKFHITPAYLYRIFKKEINIGPAEYLQRVRIEAAKKLLLQQEMSIHEISEAVGYQYILTFNRTFKKHTGITPTQFIEQNS